MKTIALFSTWIGPASFQFVAKHTGPRSLPVARQSGLSEFRKIKRARSGPLRAPRSGQLDEAAKAYHRRIVGYFTRQNQSKRDQRQVGGSVAKHF